MRAQLEHMAGCRDQTELLKIGSFHLAPDPMESQSGSYSYIVEVPNFYCAPHTTFDFTQRNQKKA